MFRPNFSRGSAVAPSLAPLSAPLSTAVSPTLPQPRAISAPVKEAPARTKEKVGQPSRQQYPDYKVIVLNDEVNTFNHVAECLMKYLPQMSSDRAWKLTHQIHNEGQAIVWVGPLEQAEMYHQQLSQEGLTLAPIEKA